MLTHVPFTDFTLGLTNVNFPITIDLWISYYNAHFRNAKPDMKGIVDIESVPCEAYRIGFDAPINIVGVGKFSTAPLATTLFISSSLFYHVMYIGDDHLIGSAAISYLKSNDYFVSLGGGRFRSKSNGITLSFEEDELGKFYLLITSHEKLLSIDPLFNFARQTIQS